MATEGWAAQLVLNFDRTGEKTLLRERRHLGPLRVQRPFYPEGDPVCHVYILHPPGGVVGGDSLNVSVTASGDGHALITTPAAGKFYRSAGPYAELRQTLKVASKAVLEWLPQETIVYSGAKSRITTRIELERGARFLGWEVVCLGLPASGRDYIEGDVRQSFEVWQDGEPLWLERGRFEGQSEALSASWGLGQHTVVGTLICTANDADATEKIRHHADDLFEDDLLSATTVSGLTVCRYLGRDGFRAMRYFTKAWETLRPVLCNRPACAPRVWRT